MQDCIDQLNNFKQLKQLTRSFKPKRKKTRKRIQKYIIITGMLLITSLVVIRYGIAS